ncbi:MAG: protease modulator HflC [Thermodesulfobacteriota bacterium]
MKHILRVIGIGAVIALAVVVMDAFFILPEGQQAVITQFGRPVGVPIVDAGIHYKTPFIQEITYFEKRILIWDGDPNQIPTNDKTFIYLDVTARWRIADALQFLQAANNETRAMTLLDDILDGTVRDLVNKNNLVEIIRSSDWQPPEGAKRGEYEEVRAGRDRIVNLIYEQASKQTRSYGIELVDVMFKRVNYIDSVRQRVYDRMISERKRIAAEKRSLGEGEKAEILGRVERELKEITSGATREAEEIRGRADAEAARIYADAYNQDPEFYSFLRTMESYRKVIGDNTRLILTSDSDFYRYLKGARLQGER